jgi:hypothetical protein
MNTFRCQTCSGPKTNFESPWCETCLALVTQYRAQAAAEGTDVGEAQRRALRERAHSVHQGHADSRTLIQRIQFDDLLKRKAIVPGSPDDPCRGQLPS